MQNKHLALALGAALALSGCSAMSAMGDAMNKMAAANTAKQRADENNIGTELKSAGRDAAAQAWAQLLSEQGFRVQQLRINRGPGGGINVVGRKQTNKDIASQVGLNLLGNMVGADRGKIIKRHDESIFVNVWSKWDDSYTKAVPGVAMIELSGESADLTQNDQSVNYQTMDFKEMERWRSMFLAKAH
jgi:hypothetical protein